MTSSSSSRPGRASRLAIACSALLCAGVAAPAFAVPSFARQTGMTGAACHTMIPELTPFGREFKLNGYVLDNLRQIRGETMERRQMPALNPLAPISAMLQVSYARTGQPLPDSAATGALAKDGEVLFPQQVSLFYVGKIANRLLVRCGASRSYVPAMGGTVTVVAMTTDGSGNYSRVEELMPQSTTLIMGTACLK